jgi:anion-transporting  ArsA/GET3 family ATPase
VVLERRLLLVTGKGGTGKSAVAASLAIAAGRRGLRVLALAMDGGAGLARHLRASPPGPLPQRCGDVSIALVDPGAALDQYLRLRVRVPRIAAVGRVFAAMADTVPGIRDTVMIGKVVFESTRSRWDLVVADAPPTGQVQSYLGAPATIAGLVPSGVVRDQASWMANTLADPVHSAAVVVATPEELPAAEAAGFVADVARSGAIPLAAVVANRVLPAADFPPPAPGDTGPAAEAARLHLALVAEQGRHLEALAPTRTIPHLFGVHTPGETAERIADFWEEP